MRIQFLESVTYESEGRNQGPRFEAGDVYDCRRDFGERWVNRNLALHLEGEFPEPKPPVVWQKVEAKPRAKDPAPAAAPQPAPAPPPASPQPSAAPAPAEKKT